MVPRDGIEPPTPRFSVACSTNWATWAQVPAENLRLSFQPISLSCGAFNGNEGLCPVSEIAMFETHQSSIKASSSNSPASLVGILYASFNHFERSNSAQRLEQNGRYFCSQRLPQIGHFPTLMGTILSGVILVILSAGLAKDNIPFFFHVFASL